MFSILLLIYISLSLTLLYYLILILFVSLPFLLFFFILLPFPGYFPRLPNSYRASLQSLQSSQKKFFSRATKREKKTLTLFSLLSLFFPFIKRVALRCIALQHEVAHQKDAGKTRTQSDTATLHCGPYSGLHDLGGL